MKTLKALTRIPAGFGAAAIFLTMALVVLVTSEMHRIKTTATRITGDTMPSIYLSGQLQSATLLRYILLTDYVAPNDNVQRTALDKQIDEANSQIDDVIAEYDSLIDSRTDRQLFETLKSTRAPYDECFNQVLVLSRQGHVDEAQILIGTQLIPLRNTFLKAAEAEVVWNKADADDSINKISEAVNWTSTSILLCLLFSLGIGCVALVIRQLLQIQMKLQASDQRFQEVFEHAPVGIYVAGPDERFVRVNEAYCRMLGYSEDELLARNWVELCIPEEQAVAQAYKDRMWKDGTNRAETDRRYIHRNGTTVWCKVKVSFLRTVDGSPLCSVIHAEDITERRKAENALRESENRFRIMADSCPTLMWVTGPTGETEFVNREYRSFCGLTIEQAQHGEWRLLLHPDDAPEYVAAFRRAVTEHTRFNAEVRVCRADGEWRLIGTHAEPRLSPGGEYMGHIGLSADITERKQAQEALQESEQRFRLMADGCPTSIWVTDAQGGVQFTNRTYTEFCGVPHEDVEGRKWQLLIHPDDLPELVRGTELAVKTQTTFKCEMRAQRFDGEWRWIFAHSEPHFSLSGQFLGHVGNSTDITERKEAEQALLESETRFRIMADSCPIGIWVTDAHGMTAFINRVYREFIGASSDHIEESEWLAHVHPDDMQAFTEQFKDSHQRHTDFKLEVRNLRRDGEWRWVNSFAVPRMSSGGEFLGLVGINQDITERILTEQALRSTEEKFRQMAENIREVFWMMNAAGTEILYEGPAYEEIWGRTCKSLYESPMDWIEAVHPEDRELAHTKFARQLQGENIDSEYRITTRNGQQRWIRDRAFPVRDQSGAMIRIAGIAEDITERKQADQILRDSEEKFRQLAENIREVFFLMTPSGSECFYISPAFEEVWERSLASIYKSPMSWAEAIHSDDRETALFSIARQLEGEHIDSEYRIRTPDGREKWIRSRTSPIRNQAGELIRIAGIAEDITERKCADQALRSSEEKFRQLAENIREVFRIMPIARDETLYVSPAYEEIWGRSMESIYRNPESWREAVHPEDWEQADYMAAHQLLGESVEVEYRIRTPEGQQKWIRDRAFPVRDQSGALVRIVGIAEDISERKRAEQAIVASHEFVQSTIDALSSTMCVLDEKGAIIEVNRTWKEFAVANRKAHLHKSPDFCQLNDQFGTGVNYLEACDRAVGNAKTEAAEFAAGIRSVLRGDMEEFSKEYACHAPRERRWFIAKVTRFFNHGLPRVVIEHINITTRKLAEEAMRMAKLEAEAEGVRANALAREAERATAAKSEFLANMSHEIRTPMNGVIGMTGLLLDTELTAEQSRYAEMARGSGESLLQLINDILDFSKIEAKKLEMETIDFDLRSLLDNLSSILSAMAQNKGIKLLCIADPAVPTGLRGDPGRLRQVLTNLAGNAIKFTDEGEVVVRVALLKEENSECTLRFSVRDTGIGIGQNKLGLLFEKFSQVEVSTTRKYGGTGLGLAICKQLVEMMGGEVGVKSEEGKGSEFWFTVRLERSLELAEPGVRPQLEIHPTSRLNGRILVAEDNSTNREVALGMLRKFGLRADAVANGAEAISALESVPYDLVLMDMRMPVMDGIAASRQIRNPQSAVLDHDIPIIALTANAMLSDRQNCLAAGMNDFVSKPIMKTVLLEALKKWLPSGVSSIQAVLPRLLPAKTEGDETKIFDLASVLSRLEGDNELVKLVFDTFLADVPHQVKALKELVNRGDHADIARQAHSIRGASANVGGESLRKVATQMEKAADAGDWLYVVNCMDELEIQFSLLKNAIDANDSVHTK